ncbi:MAG: DUF4403 family protein, partial [Chlorobiales bacterium]|nr:DUF4403 family protein [Chlorobiales bacterium]
MTEPASGKRSYTRPIVITAIVAALLAGAGYWLFHSYTILKTRPPAPLTEDVPLERPTSVFNLPISIGYDVLSDYLNGKLRGEFLQADLWLQKKKKERITLTLTREEQSTLSSDGRELYCT